MGQTLTHGIYLPDEGERNCYSGLAANWQLLDGAVGTVAEHTTALAGKAPAVHTHTKADITDFPVYGTTAGTICEGNDSRLSDARTPVAHTHVTADVTDLLNTSHEWTKIQTYSDVNAIIIKNNNIEIGNEPSAYNEQRFLFRDKNNQQIAAIKYQNQLSSVGNLVNGLEFSITDKFKDGVRDATGTAITAALRIGFWHDGTKYIYNECRWRSNLLPFGNNTNDIGSSSYQWNNVYSKRVNTQTLNGINPGALSLPKTDISITSISVSGFSFDGSNERVPDTTNLFSNGEALVDGWLCAKLTEDVGHYIIINSDDNPYKNGVMASCFSSGVVSTLSYGINVYVPVKVGDKPAIRWTKPNGGNAQLIFYPCFGNV